MNKSLLESNPHLKDPERCKRAIIRNIITSSAVEGIRVKFDEASGQFVHEDAETSNG